MSKNRQSRRAAAAKERRKLASRQAPPKPSQSRGRLAAKALDGFSPLRDGLARVAADRGDWAGIPMPLEGERLVIEPSYPKAAELMAFYSKPAERDHGWRERNRWYSDRLRSDVIMVEKDGKFDWCRAPAVHHIAMDLSTLGCCDAWGLEQEHRALLLLGTMVRHRQMKQYVLTGTFIEKSARSGISYIFRRLKPTVALAAHPGLPEEKYGMRILAALCMHPIGYYAGSWAGAMCPTDDVIAHLALMRADEHFFWKRCNQHPPYRPEAGL